MSSTVCLGLPGLDKLVHSSVDVLDIVLLQLFITVLLLLLNVLLLTLVRGA